MANIEGGNPDRIALIEMHCNTSYTSYGMFLQEARSRWYWYPPPYWYNGAWYRAYPWLWYDGDPHAAYTYANWGNLINQRLTVPAPFTITMWGDWNPALGTGTIYAQFRNDSTEALTGNVLFVVTEDSIYRVVPNGDQWHNHVARDYLPTYIGETVTIPAGDSLTLSRTFALDTEWNPDMINFVTWIQDTLMQPDSVIEIWQGGQLDITELGVHELGNTGIAAMNITTTPNPCVNGTRFSFILTAGEKYRIGIYDITGRKIWELDGIASGTEENIEWNLQTDKGSRVSAGIYLYHFESNNIYTTGKVVVR
ncbi:MAG: Omp28-related outer membrane protein [candidate division WOR-3 bacterium]|nr:MAG: Omp28-related outer membrane protein [candidate division WOR-3 bacterium]